jgi:hypothetical protein
MIFIYDHMTIDDLHSDIMGTIANLTNTTTEFINRITDLDIGITITTSMLSIIGACVIFLSFALKWNNSETDRELMTFLV